MSDTIPLLVIRVTDLNTSIAFYRDKLGFSVVWHDPDRQVARLRVPGNDRDILLTDNPELDIPSLVSKEMETDSVPPEKGAEPYLGAEGDEPETAQAGEDTETDPPEVTYEELGKDQRLEVPGENLMVFQERLATLGVPGMVLEEYPGIEQVLTVPDPDGYTVAFRESLRMSDADVLSLYRKGPDLLEGAIIGLSEEHLDLAPEEGEWTIRQSVLHVVDFDMEMMQRIKWALAESGREYKLPLFDPDEWAEALDYANRSIQGEVAAFRYLREHILTLCEHIPDALDRNLVSEQGTVEVRTMMQVVAENTREYVQNILDTRRIYQI